jgi:hypothetical protein
MIFPRYLSRSLRFGEVFSPPQRPTAAAPDKNPAMRIGVSRFMDGGAQIDKKNVMGVPHFGGAGARRAYRYVIHGRGHALDPYV